MSLDPNGKGLNKIRWDRMFTTVSGDGQPKSYFRYFLFALITYFGISYFVRKRKEKKN
jgi:signal peptidase I